MPGSSTLFLFSLILIHVCTYICTCIYPCTYTYIHAYGQTYMHTRIYVCYIVQQDIAYISPSNVIYIYFGHSPGQKFTFQNPKNSAKLGGFNTIGGYTLNPYHCSIFNNLKPLFHLEKGDTLSSYFFVNGVVV